MAEDDGFAPRSRMEAFAVMRRSGPASRWSSPSATRAETSALSRARAINDEVCATRSSTDIIAAAPRHRISSIDITVRLRTRLKPLRRFDDTVAGRGMGAG